MDVSDIETITVLGAGNMGHGIAQVAAMAGFDVIMRDISDELVQEGYDSIEWSLGKLADQGRFDESEIDTVLARINPVVDVETAVSDVDFLIEAVPERMDIKREVYEEVEAYAPADAVFATNTSSLSITELSEATDRPGRFCGMHFFNPPVRMELVEVISGEHTTGDTLDLAEALTDTFGKTPIRVRKDTPGFVVNRVLVPFLNEAAWIVHSGDGSVAAVDATTKFDMALPMGAFELADQVGIDVALDVLEYMHDTLGDAYAPCPLLEEKVDAGAVGRKAGAGFYDYDNGGVQIPADAGEPAIERRLVAVMANEVAKLIEADAADPAVVDKGLQLGAGFPDGPAARADDTGIGAVVDTLTDLHTDTGASRYEPARLLVDYANAHRGFYTDDDLDGRDPTSFETIHVEHANGVGRITLDRPHRMNAISPNVLDELDGALDALEREPAIRSILLLGEGDRAFSVGADAQGMASGISPVDAVDMSRRGQQVFGRFEETDLPVVAGIDGFALGGGMELAAAADLRLASERSEFGQPEHNLGLLPGWGGTQRLARIVGEGRAKEIIFTADRYDPDTMLDYGFLTDVVDNDALEDRAMEVATELAAGPPVAQGYTKRAMHAGRDDMTAGLDVEATAFGVLMTTDDVIEGITAFMEDRDPEFTGE